MRGFPINRVGPVESHSVSGTTVYEPLGGTVQLFSMFEVEHPLIRSAGLKLAAFFDVGNSFGTFPGADAFSLRMDWGVGLRWFSPLGPLRFEWAFPIRPQAHEGTGQFWFYMGTPF